MRIILKYLLTNIKEKKLRTLLILLAVTLSSALFFGTSGMSTTLEAMFTKRLSQYFGTADIMVYADENSPSWSFRLHILEPFKHLFRYTVGTIQSSGVFKYGNEKVSFNLAGFKLDELQRLNPLVYREKGEVEPFEGNKIIIGAHTAREFNLAVGDSITLEEVVGAKRRFQIVGIGEDTGFLMDDGNGTHMVILPLNKIAGWYNARGQVSTVYAATREGVSPEEALSILQKELKRYYCRETVSDADKASWAQSITIPFRIMMILVMSISVFIIFTCFQVITAERLPVIGTFRSIGASKRITDAILLGESLLYGLIGGVLGIFLGLGFMYILTLMSTDGWLSSVGVELVYTPGQITGGIVMAVILSLVSSGSPILKISKLSIKDVILNTGESFKPPGKRRLVVSISLVLFGILAPLGVKNESAMLVDTLCLIGIMAGMVGLNPFAINVFILFFEKIFIFLFGNLGVLGAKNIRNNTSILNNLGLLSIGIGGLFMIFTLSNSISATLTACYSNARFQAQMSVWPSNRSIEYRLRAMSGVQDCYGMFQQRQIRLPDYGKEINLLQGAKPEKYEEFWAIRTKENKDEMMDGFFDRRYIILSYVLKKQLNIEKGDNLVLELAGRQRTYKVKGFFDTMRNNGSLGLVPESFLKADCKLSQYNHILIKTEGDVDTVLEKIRVKLKNNYPWIRGLAEVEAQERASVSQLTNVLKGFGFLTMFIGIVGIVNNFIISFIKRKRSLALLRSVGMSKAQGIKMLFIEALSCGIAGTAMGVLTGALMFLTIPRLLDAYNLSMLIFFSGSTPVLLFILGTSITLVASVIPAARSSKLNIIEAVKYE